MYCPKCGQQISIDARFCSRCGMPMSAVSDLIANNGFPVETQSNKKSPRRRGMRWGAKLMFFSAVLLPIFFGLSFPADSPAPLLVPITVFLAGLSLLLYSRIFWEDNQMAEKQHRRFDFRLERLALRPPENVEGQVFIGRQTGEIAEQPSVTEGTTHLFDQTN